ncbi:hypothetical protein BC833DRAFT_533663 [Globomyces pollinis-pini]|nr:hypothetical protein BC833DRAFT_533663 [Globomyces pollinis-pini]
MKLRFTALLASFCYAGPLSYRICQTGCNTVVVACYAGAELTLGSVTAGAGTKLVASKA